METDDTPCIDQEVVDALDALGDRTRLEILLALATAERAAERQPHPISFSTLYDAVDVDSSSQFSYHLSQLVGSFVAKSPDGYRLTYGGAKLVRAIRSGVYESTPQFDPVSVDGACVFCEATALVATLADEHFVVRCDSCESTLLADAFPRSQARNRAPTAVVESFGHCIWSTCVQLGGSVCPECHGRVDTVVDVHERDGRPLYSHRHTCRECWFVIHLPIEVAAAFHPAAIGFLWKIGVSLLDLPLWEFFELLTSGTVATDVRSTDPFEAVVTISADDEACSFVVDDAATATLVGRDE